MANNLSVSKLPRRIDGLDELAHNLWWSWSIEARQLFKALDAPLWKATGHNPVKLLQQIESHRLVAAAQEPLFLEKYDSVMSDFKNAMLGDDTWCNKKYPHLAQRTIAYFSLEFAIHNSLPLYAGGLGVLAGDYCKESSDLGLPIVGVGFMYPQGYFHQHISVDGWQEEVYEQLNFNEAPISQVLTAEGQPIIVEVPLDFRSVRVTVWQVNVGRIKLYLLDTNVEGNSQPDRELSARLYAGDQETRLQKQIIIGIGGVRVLRALGIKPTIWHANEGYTAFMTLERVRELVAKGIKFTKAVNAVRATTVLSVHTLAPGVSDTFPRELIEKYLHSYWESLKLDMEKLLQLGAQGSDNSAFNTTALGLRMSDYRNGVSQLHGATCRRTWHCLWADKEEKNVPISSVTNGVHIPTWVAPRTASLYESYLSHDWLKKHDDPSLWEKVLDIPDEEIWAIRQWLKYKLIDSVKERSRKRWAEDHVAPDQALAMGGLVDAEALTIAFCRRFTAYKRASLILSDVGRLKRLLRDEFRPVQIIFAGKAHPNDESGKQLIQKVYNAAKNPEFGGRIAFVEDYDIHMARYLVHGADVWLNTPQLLHEASGTSGQKAAINGVLHLSVLDGWWREGYNGKNGWAIGGNDSEASDPAGQDRADAEELYRLLEDKVIPLYYDRDIKGIPHGWTQLIKEAIRSNVPLFSARRMAKEYTEQMYLPAVEASQ
jgi:starch phosphorylase